VHVSVPRALLLVLALLQAGGIIDLVRRTTCEATCERDGCKDCTPGDDAPQCACHCPTAPIATDPAIAVVTLAPPTQTTGVTFDRADLHHASPDPSEILHVPRQRAV